MPSFLDAFTAALLTYAMHSAVACGLALIAARFVRRPQDRDLVWKTALVAPILTAAVAMLTGITTGGGTFVDVAELVRRTSHLRLPGREVMVRIYDNGNGQTMVRRVVDPLGASLTAAALGLAVVVVLVAVVRFAVRRKALSDALAARRCVGTLSESIASTPIQLSVADELPSPVAFGTAEICLPAGVMHEFSDSQRRSLLAHEMTHLARRDPAWLCAAELIAALSAFQPLTLVVLRAFRRDVELICDEAAVRHTNDRHALIGALARLAAPFDSRAPLFGAATAFDGSPLVARAERIATLPLSASLGAGRGAARLAAAAMIAALCAIPVFSFAPRNRDFPSTPSEAMRRAHAEGRRLLIDSTVVTGGLHRRTIVRVN